MARGRKKQDAPAGAPEWLVTFSDLMSLLLTFFVLLLSFSTVSEKDFNDAMMSVQGALGVLEMHSGLISTIPMPPRRQSEQQERAARQLKRRLQILGLEKQVKIEFDAVGGLKINLPAAVLFDAGQATLKPEAFPVLQDVAEILSEFPDIFVEVRGHTDTSPLTGSGGYRDNYDLSYHRAHAVMERLSGPEHIPVEYFEITAAGASQPQAPNDTEEGRQANRRVEIYVRGLVDQQKVDELGEGLGMMQDASPADPPPAVPQELEQLRGETPPPPRSVIQ